jgi:hypothetical protein
MRLGEERYADGSRWKEDAHQHGVDSHHAEIAGPA